MELITKQLFCQEIKAKEICDCTSLYLLIKQAHFFYVLILRMNEGTYHACNFITFFVADFLNGNGMRQTFVKQRKSEIGVCGYGTQWGQSFLENPYKEESSLKVSLSCHVSASTVSFWSIYVIYITSFILVIKILNVE